MTPRTICVWVCALTGCARVVDAAVSTTSSASSSAVGTGGDESALVSSSISSVGSGSSTSTGPGTKTCEELTTMCFGDGHDRFSGCAECSIFATSSDAVNGGLCHGEYTACFGTYGDCADGRPECCTYTACIASCDKNNDGALDEAELACVCTIDANGVCAVKQTDTSTCLGAFEASAEAYQIYQAFKKCVAGPTGVCSHICYAQ